MDRWAQEHELPTVEFYPVTAEDFADPAVEMNPDGIHWSLHTHQRIADAVAPAVAALLP